MNLGGKVNIKIQFYIPKGELIPTQLRLKIDDKYEVHYDKVSNELAWDFKFFNEAIDCYEMLLDKITYIMDIQIPDLWTSMRETKREVIEKNESQGSIVVRVYFKMVDNW